MNSLSKVTEIANKNPIFTPALGYTYYPPTASLSAPAAQTPAAQSSRETSVAPSQSNTAAALEGGSQSQPGSTNGAQATDARGSFALFESFQMMMRYGDEYMDENPLRGEPGNFTFSATKERLRAKQAEAEAAKIKEAELAKKLEETRAAAAATPFSATPFAASTTAAKAKADAATADGRPVMKRSKTGDKKKRKSRNATSPTSPMTPATPATPAS